MVVKPIIKWVGGKTQILPFICEKFIQVLQEKELNNYYEIFLGGGAVLLGLLSWIKEGKIKITNSFKVKAFDINKALIYMYINIRDNPKEIYDIIQPLIEYFHSVEDKAKEEYYYQLRDYYNSFDDEQKKTPTASALFIFLNKTGFRGLYREGPKGYNVPYGHYKNPEILNYEHLMEISSLIQNVEFQVMDFSQSLELIENSSNESSEKESSNLVYMDPPYVPLNSKSFTKYNESDFSLEKHKLLFEMCHKIPVSFIMSNSDTELVNQSFNKYTIEKIECKRSINSKNPGEKAMEVVITKL